MKKFTLLLIILSACTLAAQNSTTRFFTPYATETITVDNTSGGKGFTSSKINFSASIQAQAVQFTVECSSGTTCPMRYTIDGTTVTSSVGQLIDYGYIITIYGYTSIKNFRAIRTTSTSASIQPVYSY